MKRLLLTLLFLMSACNHPHHARLYPLNGKPIEFSSLKGQWVIINYWATWCEPCRREIPALNAFYDQHQSEPIRVFAVNYDQLPLDQLPALLEQSNIHYVSLKKDPAHELNLGEIPGIPVTFVFSPEGQLVKTLYGEQTQASLESAIKST